MPNPSSIYPLTVTRHYLVHSAEVLRVKDGKFLSSIGHEVVWVTASCLDKTASFSMFATVFVAWRMRYDSLLLQGEILKSSPFWAVPTKLTAKVSFSRFKEWSASPTSLYFLPPSQVGPKNGVKWKLDGFIKAYQSPLLGVERREAIKTCRVMAVRSSRQREVLWRSN